MSEAIILAIIGVIATVVSGWVGWFVGKRKQNAEASLIEVQALDSIRKFYESIQKDNNATLQAYIETNRKDREELHQLRRLLDVLIDDTCLRKGCSNRIYFSTSEIEQFLNDNSKNIKEITSK